VSGVTERSTSWVWKQGRVHRLEGLGGDVRRPGRDDRGTIPVSRSSRGRTGCRSPQGQPLRRASCHDPNRSRTGVSGHASAVHLCLGRAVDESEECVLNPSRGRVQPAMAEPQRPRRDTSGSLSATTTSHSLIDGPLPAAYSRSCPTRRARPAPSFIRAYHQVFITNIDRTAALAPWIEHYNTQRRHTALGRPPTDQPPVSNVLTEYT
jgi:hypothetical protein